MGDSKSADSRIFGLEHYINLFLIFSVTGEFSHALSTSNLHFPDAVSDSTKS